MIAFGDPAAFIGRILYSSMFLILGYRKLTAVADTAGYMRSLGLPAPSLVAAIAIVVEIGGGLLLLIGYQTRLVALGLALYVLVTAFVGHFKLRDPNQFEHFMKNLAIVGGSLAFVAFGPGACSLDT
ncbi:MAG: DoxX family protein [Alphaproteobacteria bacterium]|nr:DoxX family protein [Alphaproteobacteria bacterium]